MEKDMYVTSKPQLDNHYRLRAASPDDAALWKKFDRHLSQDAFERKVREEMAWILYVDDTPAGVLRWGMFWDTIPFLNLIFLDEKYRRMGLGRWAMYFWESWMKQQGYGFIMVSTQVDEQAQHFYRKLGYRDMGAIAMDFPGYQQPLEMFLGKVL